MCCTVGNTILSIPLLIIGVSLWLKISHYMGEFEKYEIDPYSVVCVGLQGQAGDGIGIDAERAIEEFAEIMDDATESFTLLNYIGTIGMIIAGAVAMCMDRCCEGCCCCCADSLCCLKCRACYLSCTLKFLMCADPDNDYDYYESDEGIELT